MNFADLSISRQQLHRIAYHALFWVAILIGYTLLYGNSSGGAYRRAFSLLIITLPIYMAASYYTIYNLLPNFLFRKKYLGFAIRFIYTALLALLLEMLIIMLVFVIRVHPPQTGRFAEPGLQIDIFYLMLGIFLIIVLATSIKLLRHWYGAQQRTAILAREKVEAELKMLKSQIHPHFLFNTLNNLYALTMQKSDQAPNVVLKLSQLLDYMLYECNAPVVPLAKEIEALENYITLEKLRHGERLELQFTKAGDIATARIAPLLLLPFVENSFKHGVSANNKEAWIKMDLRVESGTLQFRLANSKSPQKAASPGRGIGLVNCRKRLEMLYPNHHQMEVEDRADQYRLQLRIDLSYLQEENPA